MPEVLTGAPFVKSVITGNAKAEVIGVVILPLAIWLGLEPGFEQPQGSLMYRWKNIEEVVENAGQSCHLCLGTFGSLSSKPLDIRGSWKGVPILGKIYQKMGVLINPGRYSQQLRLTKESGRPGVGVKNE